MSKESTNIDSTQHLLLDPMAKVWREICLAARNPKNSSTRALGVNHREEEEEAAAAAPPQKETGDDRK